MLAAFRRSAARNLPPAQAPRVQVLTAALDLGHVTLTLVRPGGGGDAEWAQRREGRSLWGSAFSGRNVRRCPTLPRGLPRSTIGAEGLNFRVRDGTGCFPLAMAAATLWNCQPGSRPYSGNRIVDAKLAWSDCKCVSSPRPVSTGQLSASRRLHFRPINPVVWLGTLPTRGGGRPYLEAGFPLRCFQRLSLPDVANQPCSWRNNWHTRGQSVPVLSY